MKNDNKVRNVSKVSGVSKMSKQGEQQSPHSLRPMGEGGRRPDEGLKETGRLACTNTQKITERNVSLNDALASGSATVSENIPFCPQSAVQHDGKGLAKDAQQSLHIPRPLRERTNLLANECELRNSGEGSDKSALTYGGTAKEAHDSLRHPELVSGFHHAASLEDVTPHQVRTKLAKRSLSPTILSRKGRGMRAAFTLAELLITLAVIGIVAALTLPGLIQNHNEKAWSTAKDLWEKKLTETVRRMNTDGVMTGHDTTEDFMNTFKQYMKVIKTCDNTDINKCYSPKVVTTGKNDDPMEIETDSLTSASSMGLKDWQTNTNTMSFVVADGTTVIMAYQPECPYADPIEDTGSQVSCMGYMVDVNGKKGPNRVGKDIQLSSGVAFSTCDNPIGDMCWSTDFAPTAINTCDDTTYDQNGSANTYCANNYWAGAIKSCRDKGMSLPTRAQLAQLASNMYLENGNEVTIGADEHKTGLTLQAEYSTNCPINLGYGYWSSEEQEDNISCSLIRYFDYTDTSIYYGIGKYASAYRAVCVAN